MKKTALSILYFNNFKKGVIMLSPYKQIHIKSWACVADAKGYYAMQGFNTSEVWEDYYIMRKGNLEVMISYQDFLKVKSSLIKLEEL